MACPNEHAIETDDLEPRSFSFNSPFGACPECHGLGTRMEVDPELVDLRPRRDPRRGRHRPVVRRPRRRLLHPAARRARRRARLRPRTRRGRSCRPRRRTSILDGHADQGARPAHQPLRPRALLLHQLRGRPALHRAPAPRGRDRHQPGALRGLHARGALPGLPGHAGSSRCRWRSPCGGQEHRRGLRAADQRDRRVPAHARAAPRGSSRSPSGCSRRSRSGCASCSTSASTTSRSTGPSGSLSGGEAQRIRLATQIGAGLVGVLYVLDEPSIGLHQRDNHRLIETLVRLKDLGNTLIVVEHDEDTIRIADWVVDIGPGAGEHGGQVVVSGHRRRSCSTTATPRPGSTSPAASRSRSPRYAVRARPAAS